jgi:hypothetical protein
MANKTTQTHTDDDDLVFEGSDSSQWGDESDDAIDLDAKRPLIPDGKYPAVIDGIEIKTSKKGSDYYNVRLRLGGAADGHVLFEIISFADGAKFMTAKTLKMLLGGRKGAFHYRSQKEELVGLPCTVVVGVRNDPEYGESNDVLSLLPPMSSQPSGSTNLFG